VNFLEKGDSHQEVGSFIKCLSATTANLDGITKPSGAMGTEEQVGRVLEDENM
jgi:hypothetical protein